MFIELVANNVPRVVQAQQTNLEPADISSK